MISKRSLQRRRAALGLAAAAALVVAAPSLPAQTTEPDSGTVVFGQQTQRSEPTVWLAPIHGSLDLRATESDSNTSTTGGTDTKTRETLFQESLTLSTEGYIVHPNLVDLRLSVTGGLDQDRFSDEAGSSESNGTVYGWDTSATFLRNQSAPLTVYSRRNESMFDVPFGPTQRTTTTTTGALLDYRSTDTSLQLEAYHEDETQSDFGSDGSAFSETRDVFKGSGDVQLSARQTLSWAFDLEQATYDSGDASTDEQSMSGSLNHIVNFGDNDRSSLSSAISANRITGNFASEDLRWNEHLHLYHTPNLETNYDYTYEQLTFGSTTTDHQAAYMDARHQLYKSLTTTGRLRWDDVSTSGGSTTTYAEELDLNYRKEVPDGMLLIDAQVGHEQQDISGSGDIAVVNQPFSFTGLDAVQVTQPNVIPASILIRDAVSGRVYTEGVDYTVDSTPVGPQINRVLGGNIAAGQPLQLSYEYAPLDASEIDTNSFGIGSRYQFIKGPLAGLTPYARFYGQDQSITGGTAEPNDVRDYAVGTYYTLQELTLKVEREWYQSTLFPYDAWRYEARVTHDISADTIVAAAATYTDTQYHEPEEHTRSYSLSASLSRHFTTHLYVSLYATYANVDSDTGGQTQGLEEGLQATYELQQMKIYARVRNSSLDSDSTNQQYQFFQIGLTRKF